MANTRLPSKSLVPAPSDYSASDLLKNLSDHALLQDEADIAAFIVAQQQDKELPIYLRALVGVGAFFATLCFLGVVMIGFLIEPEQGMIFGGILFALAALGFQNLVGDETTLKNSFLGQTSFAFMATGKTLLAFAGALIFESGWGFTLALLLSSAAIYPVFRMPIDRFLSAFFLLLSILANILWEGNTTGSWELLLYGFLLLQVLAAAGLLTHTRRKRDTNPFLYALLFSLCASALLLAAYSKLGAFWGYDQELSNPIFITLLSAAGLVATLIWAAGGATKILKSEPLCMALLGAILLAFISAPGIILSIALLVLGYARHETLMSGMGALLMPVLLWLYYYNLDVTLMEKSGVLIASGLALVAGSFYMRLRGWDRGDTA